MSLTYVPDGVWPHFSQRLKGLFPHYLLRQWDKHAHAIEHLRTANLLDEPQVTQLRQRLIARIRSTNAHAQHPPPPQVPQLPAAELLIKIHYKELPASDLRIIQTQPPSVCLLKTGPRILLELKPKELPKLAKEFQTLALSDTFIALYTHASRLGFSYLFFHPHGQRLTYRKWPLFFVHKRKPLELNV